MVRNSVTHLILFIAVISAATLFIGVLIAEVGPYSQSIEREADRDVAAIDTEFTIVNDPEAGTTYDEDTETVTLYIKNIGGTTLEAEEIEVLIDGHYMRTVTKEVIDSNYWRVGHVIELTIDLETSLERSEHRVAVEIHGLQEILVFQHRVAYWLDPDTGEEFEDDEYTVDLNETDTLELTMGTEPIQDDESVSYSLNNSSVATFNSTGGTTDTGITDSTGQNVTTLDLQEEGTVRVDLDIGWDTDEIMVRVIDSS